MNENQTKHLPHLDLTVQFKLLEPGRIELKREGSLDAEDRFSYAFQLACNHRGITPTFAGYSGCGRKSVSTVRVPDHVPALELFQETCALLTLSDQHFALQVLQSGILGPDRNEPEVPRFEDATVPQLKQWCLDYYQARGIDDPESLRTLTNNTRFRYQDIPLETLVWNLSGLYQSPTKVLVYRCALQSGHRFPPVICRRRGWQLLEGYHRLTAYLKENKETIPSILIGRA